MIKIAKHTDDRTHSVDPHRGSEHQHNTKMVGSRNATVLTVTIMLENGFWLFALGLSLNP